MYPGHYNLHHPYSQEMYPASIPFQEIDYYYSNLDGRHGGYQPPTGPPPGHGTSGSHGHAPPGPPPGHGHGHDHDHEPGPPTSPPPSVVPHQTQHAELYAVDPGSMVGCLHRYTYVWLRGFEKFWFYPTFIGRHSVSGYRWTGRRWVRYGVSLRQIQSFTCV